MEIKQTCFSDLPSELVLAGKKEGLIFRDKDNALYFGGYVDNALVCVECLVTYKGGSAEIKANYTVGSHRGQGLFTKLNKHVLEYARGKGIKTIRLNCLKDSLGLHQKQGARLWKTTKNIYWLMYDEGF